MDSLMPIITQLVGALSVRDRTHQSKAELEEVVRKVVDDCLQKQAAAEQKDMVKDLMAVLKESVARPVESRPVESRPVESRPVESRPVESRQDLEFEEIAKQMKGLKTGKEAQASGKGDQENIKKLVMEVLQEHLDSEKLGKPKSRAKSDDFVLPWCDKSDVDRQSKFPGKGKKPPEKKGIVNDVNNKNFSKEKGAYEKQSFDQSKNFDHGRGGFRGANRRNYSQERFHGGGGDGTGHHMNNAPQNPPHGYVAGQNRGGPHGYVAGQNRAGPHGYQHGQQEGAVGYSRGPNFPQHHGPASYEMHQQQYGAAPNYQHGDFRGYVGHPLQQPGYPGGQPPRSLPSPLMQMPLQNNAPYPSYNMPPPHHQPFKPLDDSQGKAGGLNNQPTRPNFSSRGHNFRGRGGYPPRGGYQTRGGHHMSRPESRGPEFSGSLSDLAAILSPEEVKTIKNVLKSDASNTGANQKKTGKNTVAFKPKKNNVHGKPIADENDEPEEVDAKNVEFKDVKTSGDKLPDEVQTEGAKKKKKNNVNKAGSEGKPKAADIEENESTSKLIVGLGINKDVLNNVDLNQPVKHVVLIASSGNETKTCQPKIVKELKDFMEKYPDAEAIIVKKEK